MLINYFLFNGVHSYEDMGIIITETPAVPIPERDVTFIQIQGRSGDLFLDNGRYKNVERIYKIAFSTKEKKPIQNMIDSIINWLRPENGYMRLEDSYTPDCFFMAVPAFGTPVDIKKMLLGETEINFNCKPYKYKTIGQDPVYIDGPKNLINNGNYPSEPYIKVYGRGNGVLSINNNAFPVSGIDGYIEIDSETENASRDGTLQNHKISFIDFPVFKPGSNTIVWNGGISNLEIIPRWRTL